MIQADFYPTIQTEATDVEYTDFIENLDNSIDMFHPYVMGYLPGTYIPDQFFISEYDATDAAGMENDGIIFRPAYNKAANFPWFFTACRKTSTMDRRAGKLLFLDGAWSDFNNSTSENDYQLLNGFNISLNGFRSFTFSFNCSIYDNTRNVNIRTMSTVSTKVTVTAQELIDFLYNDGTIDLTISHSGYTSTSTTLTLSSVDFQAGWAHFLLTLHHVKTDQDCEVDIHIVISSFTWTISRIVNEGGSAFGYPNEAVAFQWETTDGIHVVSSLNNGGSVSSDGYIYIRKDSSRMYEIESGVYKKTILDKVYVGCGLDGDIPGSFVRNAPAYTLLLRKNFVVQVVGASRIAVVPLLLLNDLKNTLCFIGVRIMDIDSPYGFSDDIYVPHYKADDSPNFDLLNGDLETIVSDLRPWQMYNINNNDFTWEDIPPYVPPGSGDDSGGDDIRPTDWTNLRIGAANNFITLYGMTAETVSDFGRKMWAELADPEFWQMVGTAFTNDFSINPADMMRYFVSLRYFPFDVSDFAHTTSSGVYIGRAASPIAPSVGVAYPLRLTNSTVQVSGGTVTIPRRYNDFRDYEPCTTVQVHIPFCGSVEIPASEVMGHPLDLTYKIDLQTGAMMGVLCVQSDTYYVIATVAGTVGASIPITANNNIEFLQRIATLGGGLVGGGVSGALKGAMLGGEVGAVVGAVAGTVGGGVGALAGLPPVTVHKQGNASGFANLGGVPYAYATVQRSRFELPDNYGHTTGYACDFAATVSELSGYTVCDNVDTSGLSCNAQERDEIKRLLESGVYV